MRRVRPPRAVVSCDPRSVVSSDTFLGVQYDRRLLDAAVGLGRFAVEELAREAGASIGATERWVAGASQVGWLVEIDGGFEVTAAAWTAGVAPGCGG